MTASPPPQVRRIGLGLAALGRPAYINLGREGALPADRSVESMRAASWRVLDDAHAAGVRWVDAARSYGRAEEFLAGWLADRGHRDVTVSSKWGYAYVADWRTDADVHEVKEHSSARFGQQWAETHALLGDQVSLYQVHSLTSDSPLFGDQALLADLAALRDSGVALGFSTSGPAQADAVRRAAGIEVDGRRLFDAVQSTWNVLEPSVGPALAEAHDAGLRVLVKEALANGRLAVRPPRRVVELADRHGVGPDAVALAAVLAQPWADVVLSGAAGGDQLRSNLAATGVGLSPGELDDLAEPAEPYWATRAALDWN
ncbi:aldo/keto reductase [Solihabitans fulvus]|uniref:Aldo/keto reductase n=1 Tax=Solihabitans fulvus TaxID=1892852 RepID=A0A5B2XU98_9PSEU|nr:aldo/keto reductase [Solihabitans fulvus]KAA2266502.1 aldo/keto reductase [Solihabitans fulvus]